MPLTYTGILLFKNQFLILSLRLLNQRCFGAGTKAYFGATFSKNTFGATLSVPW